MQGTVGAQRRSTHGVGMRSDLKADFHQEVKSWDWMRSDFHFRKLPGYSVDINWRSYTVKVGRPVRKLMEWTVSLGNHEAFSWCNDSEMMMVSFEIILGTSMDKSWEIGNVGRERDTEILGPRQGFWCDYLMVHSSMAGKIRSSVLDIAGYRYLEWWCCW